VNCADLMAAQGAFETDFYDRSILRLKHCAYYRSGRPVIKIGPKGALCRHEIRPISAPSLGQSIDSKNKNTLPGFKSGTVFADSQMQLFKFVF